MSAAYVVGIFLAFAAFLFLDKLALLVATTVLAQETILLGQEVRP